MVMIKWVKGELSMEESVQDIIKLNPAFQERIWGGTRLRETFGYNIPSEKTGECWAISALKNGDCQISEGEYEGKTLSWLYENHRELFGNIENAEFPLLVKLIDAADNLSIQVHPDDEYAYEIEGQEFGKTEAWYILDCGKDTLLEIGHKANSKEQLKNIIYNSEWDQLLNYINIKQGDFFYIPSGTIHAICKNTLIYEIQQSSDLTYRLYDYNRVDNTGKQRELHIDKSIDVITVPQRIDGALPPIREKAEGYEKNTYIKSEYFKTFKYDIEGEAEITNESPFILCTVIDGEGKIGDEKIKKGDNFIIPANYKKLLFLGKLSIMMATV